MQKQISQQNLDEAIFRGFRVVCYLHILQNEIDLLEKTGFKYNQLLKRKGNMFKEEMEKEVLFLYNSFDEPNQELLFYEKTNEIEQKLLEVTENFKL